MSLKVYIVGSGIDIRKPDVGIEFDILSGIRMSESGIRNSEAVCFHCLSRLKTNIASMLSSLHFFLFTLFFPLFLVANYNYLRGFVSLLVHWSVGWSVGPLVGLLRVFCSGNAKKMLDCRAC